MGLFWFHHSRGQGHGPFVEWVCSWVLRVLSVGECSTITGNSERCESLRWSTVQHEVFKRFGTLVVRKRKPIWWAFSRFLRFGKDALAPRKSCCRGSWNQQSANCTGAPLRQQPGAPPDHLIWIWRLLQELDRGVHVENIYVKRPKRLAGLRCLAES